MKAWQVMWICVAVLLAGCGSSEETPVANSDQNQAQTSVKPSIETPKGKENDLEKEKQQIDSVAASFADACLRNDRASKLKTLTEAAQKNLSRFTENKSGFNPAAGMTYELEETTIDGSTAEVVMRMSSREIEKLQKALTEAGRDIPEVQWKIQLRRESTEWRVYAWTYAGFGRLTTFDFEHLDPVTGLGLSYQLAPVEPSPIPQAITVAEFQKSWQKDFEFQNQPAQEVLDQLAESVGLEWSPAPAVQRPVSLSLRGRSVLEAIEEVCRQIDRHPVYANVTRTKLRLSLREGPRPFPYQIVGPFMVYVNDIETFPGQALGRLKLRCVGLGLPPGVGYHQKDLRMESLRDAGGNDVYDADTSLPSSAHAIDHDYYLTERAFALKNLVRDSRSLKLQASLSVLVPTDIQEVSFDSLQSGARQSIAGVTVTIDEFKKILPQNYLIRVTAASSAANDSAPGIPRIPRQGSSKRAEPLVDKLRQLTVFCYDDTGVQLLSRFRSGWQALSLSRGMFSAIGYFSVVGEVKSMRVFATTAAEEVDYQVALDVPLPSAALLPERIVLAKFPGHAAPVSITFLGLVGDPPSSFRKIEVEVVNHSDKAIRELDLNVIFRNATGESVGEGSAKHTGYMSRTPDKPYFLEKQGQARLKLDHALSVPDETAKTELAVERVVFADATEWTPEMATAPAIREPQELPVFRHWADRTGKFAIEARFLRLQDEKAVLEKKDGNTIEVAPEQLSDKDQEYLRARTIRSGGS